MQKIPTLYERDPHNRRYVTDQITEGCEWALTDPRAQPTRKWDGTCTMLDTDGRWWARREVKPGKTTPSNYLLVSTDERTGKSMGWEPAGQSSFAQFHAEALENAGTFKPGTYELVGPNINGNPDGFGAHILIAHGWTSFSDRLDIGTAPRDYEGLRAWLLARPYEGLVWHHPDGRRAKLKKKDMPR
jgi:hypothetical protein